MCCCFFSPSFVWLNVFGTPNMSNGRVSRMWFEVAISLCRVSFGGGREHLFRLNGRFKPKTCCFDWKVFNHRKCSVIIVVVGNKNNNNNNSCRQSEAPEIHPPATWEMEKFPNPKFDYSFFQTENALSNEKAVHAHNSLCQSICHGAERTHTTHTTHTNTAPNDARTRF